MAQSDLFAIKAVPNTVGHPTWVRSTVEAV
jgi:hypothetical protein